VTHRQILNFWKAGAWLNVISGVLHGVGYFWFDFGYLSFVMCVLNVIFAYICSLQVSKMFWYG